MKARSRNPAEILSQKPAQTSRELQPKAQPASQPASPTRAEPVSRRALIQTLPEAFAAGATLALGTPDGGLEVAAQALEVLGFPRMS